MAKLVIEDFPLTATRLIEASAGTGKTYTISGLYLRLLLERDIDVTQILVVTFTEAATQELRGRIRKRIYDALRFIEGKYDKDDFSEMLQPYKGSRETIQRLRDAITRMDEASIYTIHGFSQRTLTDSAFESGLLFDAEFVTDETKLRQQIARDFWRLRVVNASRSQAEWVGSQWATPQSLLHEVGALVASPEINIVPDPDSIDVRELTAIRDGWYEKVRTVWPSVYEEIYEMLSKNELLGRAKETYKLENLDVLFEEMVGYVAGGDVPEELPSYFELLTESRINDSKMHKRKESEKGTAPPAHTFFDLAEKLLSSTESMKQARLMMFMVEAAEYFRSEIVRRKEKSHLMFFDDLLGKLDQALQGPGGDALATRIRQHYPIAMIDEFQDTDPVQYRIFNRIYSNASNCAFFMIGDPKQAIYSFRGADIFTYMQARRDVDKEIGYFNLDTNFRSHSDLIAGVNSIFSKASAPFVYQDEIDFIEVSSAGDNGNADKNPLRIDGIIPSPLVCWHVPVTDENRHGKNITKTWAAEYVSRGCAIEVAGLLNSAKKGDVKIGARPLVARDIAVLVRDRFDAANIRRALSQQGIASVYISRDSVFDSDEARDLSHLLHAVAEPRNATLLRTAMATRLMGMSAREISELNENEIAWEKRVLSFQYYQKVWNRHGFMPMFHALLRKEKVIPRLLSLTDGERRMTDLLHLAELTQIASLKQIGVENILRWLADERAMSDGNVDDQQLRMESDEDLVQIVSIHKSKGLEYSVVFLPYPWGSKSVKNSKVLPYHDEVTKQLCADLGSGGRNMAMVQAERERLAEDLRLLYVALTRARYRCYFSWGRFNGADKSAMAYLLHQEVDKAGSEVRCTINSLNEEGIRADLEKHNSEGKKLIDVVELPSQEEFFSQFRAIPSSSKALRFTGTTRQQWSISSFSSLTADATTHGHDYQIEQPDHDQIMREKRGNVERSSQLSPFNFPRGAQAGLFLHHLFENIDFPTAEGETLSYEVARSLEQYGIEERWQQLTESWVRMILDTPLNENSTLRLRDINSDRRLVEMEFYFPLTSMDAREVNTILSNSRGAGRRTAELDFDSMSGLMKGFIDLIFEHDGQFYVLDYKSNHLGEGYEDYQPEHLINAMDDHLYDLQYLIYTVALHRYLQRRVPDYDYQRHFGGVYYLFLRGMKPEQGHLGGVFFDRPEFALIDALDSLFSGEVCSA